MVIEVFKRGNLSVDTDDLGFDPQIFVEDEYVVAPEALCDLVNFLVSAGALEWTQEDGGYPSLSVTAL